MTFSSNVGIWQLSEIIAEFRGITGRPANVFLNVPDANAQFTDAQIVQLINYYYQYVLPKELKIFWGYTNYQFYAQANIDQYVAPSNFQQLNPQVSADGWPLSWYIDPGLFYQDYPQHENKQTVANGNGALNSFSFQVSAYPVLPGSVYVTDGTQVAQDNGNGSFFDPNSPSVPLPGSINYIAGTVAGLGFTSAPAANATITCTYYTYLANRPQAILFYKQSPLSSATQAALAAANMFVLRPVPDQPYLIKMSGIQLPAPMVNYTDVPFRADLGPLIALGAALHMFKLYGQLDQYAQFMPEYLRFKDVCMQDTYELYLYQRSVPAF
jgi:hypothetical protein